MEGGDALSGVADSMLRLCPALEARISDLRRDNTAAAQFLDKAQVPDIHSFIRRFVFRNTERAHQQTQFVTKDQVIRFSDVFFNLFIFMGKPLVLEKILISSRLRVFTDCTLANTLWCSKLVGAHTRDHARVR